MLIHFFLFLPQGNHNLVPRGTNLHKKTQTKTKEITEKTQTPENLNKN